MLKDKRKQMLADTHTPIADYCTCM